MRVGITGGVGCGKSTVARALEQRGFRRLDSDQIVRDEVLTDPAVVAALQVRYGEAILEKETASHYLRLPHKMTWLRAKRKAALFAFVFQCYQE